jgi:protoporphyrinogen oxidase
MNKNIAIIGGGIAGLSSAYRLSDMGCNVTLLESSGSLGGLGTFFEFEQQHIDRFYHCIMPSDSNFLKLIDDLGHTDKLYWRDTLMGMVYQSEHYPFNTPLDLLRFTPLSLLQRFRLGGMSVLLPRLGRDDELDATPIRDWLTRLFGEKIWRKFWEPMFSAKFGVGAATLPSLYLSKRLGRESNVATRGYITDGLYGLIQSLAAAIEKSGGTILKNARVRSVHPSAEMTTVTMSDGTAVDYDCVISTIPVSVLKSLLTDHQHSDELPDLSYQGVVNQLLLLDRPLDNYYWTPVLFSDTPFDGVVESSALIDTAYYGGYSAAYLMKYTDRDSALFGQSDESINTEWTDAFLRIYGDRGISRENIKHSFVFKAPYVEPIYPLNYSSLRPNSRFGNSTLFLSTTAQVYPNITSWNSSIRVAEGVVSLVANFLRENGQSAGYDVKSASEQLQAESK